MTMQTRSSPNLATLHRLARRAAIPDYLSLPKNILYKKLQEQFNIERLQRAESRETNHKRPRQEPDSSIVQESAPKKRKKVRAKKTSSEVVVNTVDPIMFAPLGKHTFKFTRPNGSCVIFNVESLIDYLLSTGDFSDPETRIPFSDVDLKTIDSLATSAGMKRNSVYTAKYNGSKAFEQSKFMRDALQSVERCAGELIADMLTIIETCDGDEAEMRLVMREFPMFADYYRQLKAADAEYAKRCMKHWVLFIKGPPNRPTVDETGIMQAVLYFLRSMELDNGMFSQF